MKAKIQLGRGREIEEMETERERRTMDGTSQCLG